jgi:lipid A 3-O-deacylase
MSKTIVIVISVIGSALAMSTQGAEPELSLAANDSTPSEPATLTTEPAGIWQAGVGEGFRSSDQSFSFDAGVAHAMPNIGGKQTHNLALESLTYGHMLSGVMAQDHWYRGNLEFRAELFGGEQFYPAANWVVGLTPHLRYDFATGTRWIPFVDAGAGASATGIGYPDLSGTFEFNLQAYAGVHYFIRDNLALTFQAGFMHLSDAGLHEPNQGINFARGLLGVAWFF